MIYLVVILAWAASLGGAGWYSYNWGAEAKQNEIAAAQKEVQDKTIILHNEHTIDDMMTAAEVEQEKAAIREAQLKRRSALELDIERKRAEEAEFRAKNPNCPGRCDLDAASMGLLRDHIRAANNKPRAAPVVPGGVSGTTNPGERPGVRDAPVP